MLEPRRVSMDEVFAGSPAALYLMMNSGLWWNRGGHGYGNDPGAAEVLKRRGMLSATLDKMGEQHAIALIAGNFADDPPSTPQRAAMFAMTLDEAPRG